MKIEKIMTTRIVTVNMDDPLKVVKGIFDNVKFHHLLVTDKGKLEGVISDRDLFRSLSPRLGTVAETTACISDLNKRAHQIMNREPVVLTLNAKFSDAVALFNHQRISCIPIVNEAGKPVGIVTWRDIIKTLEPLEEAEPESD